MVLSNKPHLLNKLHRAIETQEKNVLDEIPPRKAVPFGKRVIDDAINSNLTAFSTIAAILKVRGAVMAKQTCFTSLDVRGKEIGTITYQRLLAHSEKIAQVLFEKARIAKGDSIILLYRKTEIHEFASALFGCFYAGVVAVPYATPSCSNSWDNMMKVIDETGAKHVLTTETNFKSLTKEASSRKLTFPNAIGWWKTNGECHNTPHRVLILDFGYYNPEKEKNPLIFHRPQPKELAYIEYSRSIEGELNGVQMTHGAVTAQCFMMKGLYDFSTRDIFLTHSEYRHGTGLILSVLLGIYSGMHVMSLPLDVTETPSVWLQAATKYNGTVIFADYLPFTFSYDHAEQRIGNDRYHQQFARSWYRSTSKVR
jgi:acyl-CoA synthetase (AMP-forming)/AMP-acid ligase II